MEQPLTTLKILKEIAEQLNEGTELGTVLQDVLKMLLRITGFKTGWIFLMDSSGNNQLAAYENLPPALSRDGCAPMCTSDCWCVDKYARGLLRKATNIMECKRLEDAVLHHTGETQNLTHHATVPLRAGEEHFGLLNVASPHKTRFDQTDLNLLEAVAFQIGTAVKRIRLTAAEQETALAAERNRLARDLHDSVNQLLFSVSLTARAGKEMKDHDAIRGAFKDIQEMSQSALAEMKALIWQLRPRGLEDGVVNALKTYGEMIGLHIHSEIQGLLCLPSSVEEALWRIGQEAFNNCKKHSGQDSVYLKAVSSKRNVHLEIWDHGKGCLILDNSELPSLGLLSMQERVKILNGTITIDSREGKGTYIVIDIPLREGKE
ncbi:GAF domain-containing sensor histidine kinase [Peribacillus kribbensis]|uniref:GAF domain-containing sensor histidine kinase n=1 Tax=Peribacillus kribbensis TaxID=356658 RepID=UPI00042044C7|nr:GAF domain-containing sensor histidine kinase [Peribacillus kribbensis]